MRCYCHNQTKRKPTKYDTSAHIRRTQTHMQQAHSRIYTLRDGVSCVGQTTALLELSSSPFSSTAALWHERCIVAACKKDGKMSTCGMKWASIVNSSRHCYCCTRCCCICCYSCCGRGKRGRQIVIERIRLQKSTHLPTVPSPQQKWKESFNKISIVMLLGADSSKRWKKSGK